MKKTIALLCAIAATNLFAVPVYAATPTSGSTLLSYSVTASYTVTIPSTINITSDNIKGTFGVDANSIIDAGKNMKFSITGATNYDTSNSKFRLKNSLGTDIYLDYIISKPSGESSTNVAKDEVFFEATPDEVNDGKTVELTYTIATPKSAGTYTDTLTISVAVN